MEQNAGPTPAPAAQPPPAPTPFDGPKETAVDLDYGILDPKVMATLASGSAGDGATSLLLPDASQWQSSADHQRQRVPLPLCEFLAYKSALAYKPKGVIEANLGEGTSAFEFFDSSGRIADTQGYAFRYDGAAFIVMRGTESRRDWAVNVHDALSGSVKGRISAWRKARLRWRYGKDVLDVLPAVAEVPGRHLGFAIAWAAVDNKVQAFVGKLPPGTPIVITGHSLGGAMAQIGAYELARRGHNVAAVVTFGAPLVGNDHFKALYDDDKMKLRQRTVLLESKGDSVPLVMRRWYYRLNRELQQFAMNLLTPPDNRFGKLNFAAVGGAWPFVREPALRESDITNAISAILDARKREAEQAEKRQKEAAEQAEKAKQRPDTGGSNSAGKQPASSTADTAKEGGSKPPPASPSGEAKPPANDNANIVLMVIAAVVLVIVLIVMWVFIARKLASHDIMHRYALYLSTLSYQRIRAMHAGNGETVAAALQHAETDLDRYLRFIRGVKGDYKGTFYEDVAKLPVRLKPDYDLAVFTSDEKNII